MRYTQLASRYARAIYTLAKDTGTEDAVFDEMRVVAEVLNGDADVAAFLASRMIRPADKMKVIAKLTESVKMQDALKNFLGTLARKGRLPLFAQTVDAYQLINDEAHGVTRGTVRSATVLDPEERKQISELVSRATKKQVVLTYKEDPALLGGLVAEVGSLTFDDSLISHLKRMNEQLTRKMN